MNSTTQNDFPHFNEITFEALGCITFKCVCACVRAWIRICAHTSNVNGFNGCFLWCCIINQVILNPSCPESQGWIWWGGKSSSCSGWSNQVSLPGWIWMDLLPINNYLPALYPQMSACSSVFSHGTIATALFTLHCFQWGLENKGYFSLGCLMTPFWLLLICVSAGAWRRRSPLISDLVLNLPTSMANVTTWLRASKFTLQTRHTHDISIHV